MNMKEAPMAYIETNRPISAIFVDLVNQFTALVRKESQLARAEMAEKIGEIGMALGLVVGGALLLIPALVIMLHAAVAGLAATGLAVGWASLIVGRGTGDRSCPARYWHQSFEGRTPCARQNARSAAARRFCSHSASEERPWNPRARGLSVKSKRPAGN
jgi:hypothetical protein